MLQFLSWFTIILYAPVHVASVSVNIDGIIDLGPKWNYEYQIKTAANSLTANPVEKFTVLPERYTRSKHHKKTKKTTNVAENLGLPVTRYDHFKPESIYNKPRAVKEDNKINEFTYHVYKQSLKVFDEIKKKVDPSIEQKVDILAKNYDVKFREFVNQTLNQKIKTRLGPQRVVLNIIDTSNLLLKRLVNYFIGDLNKEGMLRNNMAAANVFLKEVDRESELEMKHACNKFGICRTSNGLTQFLIDTFTIIIKNDDKKIKQAADALTEVLKNTDFSQVMNSKTKKRFLRKIEEVEAYDAKMVKAMFWITKNIFALKNKPINVMVTGSNHINKTVALLEIVDELDKRLPATDENILEWNDIRTSLKDWSKGKRHDILEVMQGLITFLKKKGIDKLDSATARNFNNKFELIFSK